MGLGKIGGFHHVYGADGFGYKDGRDSHHVYGAVAGSGADETVARAAFYVERGDLIASVKELETLQVGPPLSCKFLFLLFILI
jgi:hypothetical protein